jgi:ERCC4-type nuclease
MKIIIDERETALYDLFPKSGKIAIVKKVLNLGDIIFSNDDETSIYMVFERKSFRDLLASIKDGRYAEQSYRLTNCFPEPHNIVYLLEGMFSTLPREEDKKLVVSCMASLNYFKGFSVMRTVSIAETAQHILFMAEKIDKEIKAGKTAKYSGNKSENTSTNSENKMVNVEANTDSTISECDSAVVPSNAVPSNAVPSNVVPSNVVPSNAVPSNAVPSNVVPSNVVPSNVVPSNVVPSKVVPSNVVPSNAVPLPTDYCGVVKASKKANITKDNIGQMILMQIPGISSITAIEIMRPFTNFLEFIDKIRTDKTYLNSVILVVNGKKRKLGSNIIKSINELLLD